MNLKKFWILNLKKLQSNRKDSIGGVRKERLFLFVLIGSKAVLLKIYGFSRIIMFSDVCLLLHLIIERKRENICFFVMG